MFHPQKQKCCEILCFRFSVFVGENEQVWEFKGGAGFRGQQGHRPGPHPRADQERRLLRRGDLQVPVHVWRLGIEGAYGV